MQLLFAVHGYKPAYRLGGPIHSVSALAEGLARRGHRVIVFATNSNLDQDLDVPTDRPLMVDGVEVWYFQRSAPLKRRASFLPYLAKSVGFLYAPAMAAQLARVVPKVDLVHTHLPFVYPTLAAGRAAIRHRKPLFYHQRGVFDPERLKFRSLKKKLYLSLVERPILLRATTLIALTSAETQSYRRLKLDRPCRVVPNGVHLPESALAARSLPEWGLRDEHKVILFLGRVHPLKGADTLLSAFASIAAQAQDAVLVLAGPDEFGLEQRYRAQVRRLGLADRVVFAGMVTGESKRSLLARADLFCLPSVGEGFSMAALEALAAGVPVLLTPGCHFDEAEQAGAGRIVQRTPAAIAAAMLELLRDAGTLKSMGSAGRELVRSRYSWDSVVDRMLDVYEEGIVRHRRSLSD